MTNAGRGGCGADVLASGAVAARASRWLLRVVGLVLLGSCTAGAQDRSMLPEFTGERVLVGPGVADRPDYEALTGQIERIEAASDETYYVVVLRNSGDGPYATVNAIDALFESWVRRGRGFDPDRSVVILVAIDNRQISVRPGRILQERYGLSASTIDRELVQPEFIPMARQGNYPAGIAALLDAVADWIARRDGQQADRRREAEQRQAQARADAEAALAEANRLRAEARRELGEARAAGINLGDLTAQVDRAAAALPGVQGRLDADASGALRTAAQAQQSLQQALAEVRRRVAQQAEAAARLEALPERVREVDAAIAEALRADLPVGPARDDLARAQDRVDAARQALPAEPTLALERVGEAESQLDAIRAHLAELPDLLRQRAALAGQVRPLAADVAASLVDAERAGVDVDGLRSRLDPTLKAVATAMGPRVKDPRQDVATLRQALAPLRAARPEIDQAIASRRFFTRTLPLGLGLGALTIAGLALAMVRWNRQRRYHAVEGRFKEFRSRSVEVMDRLDTLKERYRLLPVLDKDFKEPMAGATLETYDALKGQLDGLWDRWLTMMDTVEKAQRLLGSTSTLGTATLREAESILERGEVFDEVRAQEQAVAADLGRLNQAHEVAEALRTDLDARAIALRERLQALASGALDPGPFAPEQAAAVALLQRGEALLTPDPLAARGVFEDALRRIGALRERIDAVLARREQVEGLSAQIDEVRSLVDRRRNAGLKLDEDSANPDPPLAEARSGHARALEALRGGDPEASGHELESASALVEQARRTIDRVLAARDTCRRDLPDRSREARNLAERLASASADHQALAADFAPESWRDVAGNLDRARTLVEGFETQLNWATGAISDSAQRYVEAAARLDQVGRQQQEATVLLDALRGRLDALRADRDQARTTAKTLAEQVRQAAQRVERHAEIVGGVAREALADAVRRVEAADRAMDTPRPDWAEIRAEQIKAHEDLAMTEERIEADLAAYDQFRQQLRRTRTRAEQVGQTLRSEDKDRAPVNNRYRLAVDALGRLEAESRTGRSDWAGLLARASEILADLDRCEQLAREDIQLANRAIAEIAEAHRGLRAAQGYTAMGLAADLRPAEAVLRQAQAALQAQDYEQAIARANSAEETARAARHAAEQEARQRQERLEAERRRRAAVEAQRRGVGPGVSLPDLAGMAAVVIGNVLAESARAGSSGHPTSSSRSSSSSRPRSPSSSTSWSSGPSRPDSPSSQSGW